MKIKIGLIIKELRIKNRITQESLASYLGVTPQAISRWESETGYPDIEILPSIASFFSVTVDELLGVNQSEKNMRLAEIHKEIEYIWNFDDKSEDAIIKAREFANEFPADEIIQTYLASKLCTYCLRNKGKNREMCKEAERILKTLIENADMTKTESIHKRNVNIERLSALYLVCFNNTEKAKEYLNLLSTLITCREAVSSRVFGIVGDNDYRNAWIKSLLSSFYTAVANDAAYNIPHEKEERSNRINRLICLEEVIKSIYNKDMPDYYLYIGTLNRFLAIYRLLENQTDMALGHLETMINNYIEVNRFDKRNMIHPERLPSIVNCFNPTVFKTVNELLTDKLKQERYNSIRENIRFQRIIDRINQIEY